MILPGKHLKVDRSLLGVGGEILNVLEQGLTVSELWERTRGARPESASPLMYDWFLLSLSFLFALDAVKYEQGVISPRSAI